jgi:hypothetical protein
VRRNGVGSRSAAWLETLPRRFWAKALKDPSGCWIWMGSMGPGGYGQVRIENKLRRANRVAWELSRGPVPEGLLVCHRRDVRACVNPDHLFLGTHQDNSDDKWAKGRAVVLTGDRNGMRRSPERAHRALGDDNPHRRVTSDQVSEIRSMHAQGASQAAIAKIFGIHPSNVSLICSRKTWGHLA